MPARPVSALRAAALVVALLLLAGCVGAPSVPADNTDPTATPTTTSAPTTSPPTSTQTSTDDADREVVAYSALDSEQQAVFDELRENGSLEGAPSSFHGLSEEIEYVRYDGTVYRIAVVGQSGHVGQNYVEVEHRLNHSELAVGQPVKNYSALDPAAQTILRDAIAGNDSAEPYSSTALPDVFGEDYVFRYNGTYYDLQIMHGDIWLYRITLEPVS